MPYEGSKSGENAAGRSMLFPSWSEEDGCWGDTYVMGHRGRSLVEGLHLLLLVRVESLRPAPSSLDDIKRHVTVHHPLFLSFNSPLPHSSTPPPPLQTTVGQPVAIKGPASADLGGSFFIQTTAATEYFGCNDVFVGGSAF